MSTKAVTFLLTDVEGSTRLWEDDPERMTSALERHDRIVAEVIEAFGGRLIKSKGEGDSCFCVFARPIDAANAAVELQRRLAAERWPTPRPITVRVALHSGVAQERDADYYGPAVNRSARLRAIAHGGQAIVSGATAQAIRADLPSGVGLKDLGTHRLKDLAEPEQVFQLQGAHLAADFPPLRSLNTFRHNLPVQLTSFVGREVEIGELRNMLEGRRLLTIVGTGGVGKTRLALQVAADLVDRFDGVWLVGLETLSDADLVPAAVAGVLGLREQADRPLADMICEHLADREVLLVLDNCEHLAAACATLAERLLSRAPDLRILATSREPLAVAGETVWRIPGLRAPASDGAVVSDLSGYESVRLFLDRAALVLPGFRPAPADLEPIARICRRLDGIPLAIELAAARLAVLSPGQVAERLDDRFGLLTGGRRTAIPRQQTLRATIEWSYELLPAADRSLLRRLSVFAGGFTVDSAESVCGGEGGAELLDRIELLVNKSLVLHDRESARYRMLETILEFAREKLRGSGEADEYASRHLTWCVAFAEQTASELRGPNERRSFEALSKEHDNFRAALDGAVAPADPEAALRLAGALGAFWSWKGYAREGGLRLEKALSAAGPGPSRARAVASSYAGFLAWNRGEYDRARTYLEGAVRMLRQLGDVPQLGRALSGLATALLNLGDEEGARALYDERIELGRATGDLFGVATGYNGLGEVARSQRNYALARDHYERSVADAREAGRPAGLALFLANLGHSLTLLGKHEDAKSRFEESIAIASAVGHERIVRVCLEGVAAVLAASGVPERAARILGAVEAVTETLGEAIERIDADFIAGVERTVLDAIGEERFDELRAEGRALNLEQAVSLAMLAD